MLLVLSILNHMNSVHTVTSNFFYRSFKPVSFHIQHSLQLHVVSKTFFGCHPVLHLDMFHSRSTIYVKIFTVFVNYHRWLEVVLSYTWLVKKEMKRVWDFGKFLWCGKWLIFKLAVWEMVVLCPEFMLVWNLQWYNCGLFQSHCFCFCLPSQ